MSGSKDDGGRILSKRSLENERKQESKEDGHRQREREQESHPPSGVSPKLAYLSSPMTGHRKIIHAFHKNHIWID